MNKAIIIGNLGADPEVKQIGNGNTVGELKVATSSRYKAKSGEWKEETEWHKVTVWGTTAENCAKYLSKGRKVAVEGRIKTEKWQDKNGQDKYTTKIIAEKVEFLGGDSGGKSNGRQSQSNKSRSGFRDEIPF